MQEIIGLMLEEARRHRALGKALEAAAQNGQEVDRDTFRIMKQQHDRTARLFDIGAEAISLQWYGERIAGNEEKYRRAAPWAETGIQKTNRAEALVRTECGGCLNGKELPEL